MAWLLFVSGMDLSVAQLSANISTCHSRIIAMETGNAFLMECNRDEAVQRKAVQARINIAEKVIGLIHIELIMLIGGCYTVDLSVRFLSRRR